MGKLKKKNSVGTAKTYVTRSQALKKLQISLADFRRLCILKGVYPHDPKYKKKIKTVGGSTSSLTTYYHAKDIRHLLHEPILEKFRQYKSYAKKLKKLIGKREWFLAKRFAQNKPQYSLDNVVKERYPTFREALRDLDDSLCHLFVFASLPTLGLFTDSISKRCQELCHEFQSYIMETHGLRKAFLSVKGIYYQAEVRGETVTWLAPYDFSQHVPPNVDFRVMLTFLEFYENFLGFINFKLYHDAKLVYPPSVDQKLEDAGAGLMSVVLQKVDGSNNDEAATKDDNIEESADISKDLPEAQAMIARERERSLCRGLFRPLTIFVSREVPKDALLFVIKSFGGQVGWAHSAYSPIEENDPRITHHIVDRPTIQNMYTTRKYVQPQWIFDCINQKTILKEEVYAPGISLPPHLSPFVDDEEDEETERRDEGGNGDELLSAQEQMDVGKAEKNYIRKLRNDREEMPDDSTVEAAPIRIAPKKKKEISLEEQEHKELAVSMLSKKKRKLYESMQRGIKNKAVEKQRLAVKKRNIAAAHKKAL